MKKTIIDFVTSRIRLSILVIFGIAAGIAFGDILWSNSKAQELSHEKEAAASPQPAENLDQVFARLIGQAYEKGVIRVIIGLRFDDYKPVGELNAAGREQQKTDINRIQNDFLEQFASDNIREIKQFQFVPYLAAEVDAVVLEKMRQNPQIVHIQEDEAVEPTLAESVPLVGAPAAWTAGFTGSGWAVAVLDTGVDKNHSFLTGKVISEACYSSNFPASNVSSVCPGGVTQSTASNSGLHCNVAVSGCTHGTHVAGIAAGTNASFSGVARNGNIIAVQVFSRFDNQTDCGSTTAPCVLSYTSDQILGLERVLVLSGSTNVAAVNMSLGGGQFTANCDTHPLKPAIDNLRSVGIATVISSGNNGFTNALGAPACISTAVSVGSTGDGSLGATVNTVSSFSNSASFLSLLAPGQWINSSVPGNGFSNFQGTSMAAPHVAGGWAILKQKKPTATVTEILNAFTSTGLAITDSRNGIVKPRIKVDAALAAISGGCTSSPITPGQTINGALATTDCQVNSRHADLYTFSGTSGQQIVISMSSTAFDTYLYLLNSSGAVVTEDDDGGGGTNSRIPPGTGSFTLPATGTYTIRATSFAAGATGAYSLTLTSGTGTCTYGVDPTSRGFSASATTSSVNVNTQTGCIWTTAVTAPTLIESILSSRSPDIFSVTDKAVWPGTPATAQVAPEAVFLNPAPITVSDRTTNTNPPGTGSLYPSTINVSGMTGTITQVDAALNGVSHTFPDDLDVILIGPGGQRAMLMSDAGGSPDAVGVNLTFNQTAANLLPDAAQIVSGTYRPSNYAGNTTIEPGGVDNFPAPGPGQTTYPSDLSVFNGTNPNGTWQLYVVDDEAIDTGNIASGWALGVTTNGGTTWINITSGSAGTGNGTVNYSVAANTGTTQRVGTITVNGAAGTIPAVHTVTQSGACSYLISSSGQSVGSGNGGGNYNVTAPTGCAWTAVSSHTSWLTTTSSGSGNGTVQYNFTANTGTSQRIATITVQGHVHTVTQAGISTPGRKPFDFDGDGKSDIGIFRPSNGQWWINRSSNGTTFATTFGTSTDLIAPADFTGDAKTDIAFFRPSNGTWFVLRSENFTFYSFPYGTSGDIPAPGDFDGDGKADAAVFRPSNATWYINRSTGGSLIQQFGATGDVPVVGNYDGDNRDDLAVWRPSTGVWWLLRSTSGLVAYQFGGSTDKPVVGDFTGDGKADACIWRPSNGTWYVLRSENATFYSAPFGTNGDQPLSGDWDGDGRSDLAVFRPSNQTWYINRTTAGNLTQTFGIAGDRAVPNAFVP